MAPIPQFEYFYPTFNPAKSNRSISLMEKSQPHYTVGWAINSSFSNQKLYSFVAKINPDTAVTPEKIGATYPLTSSGIKNLLQDLTCLQCRAILLEWQRLYSEQ